MGLGWFLHQKFRDNRPQDEKRFRHFALGPRGLVAYGGILLLLLGAASSVVGLFLPAILH